MAEQACRLSYRGSEADPRRKIRPWSIPSLATDFGPHSNEKIKHEILGNIKLAPYSRSSVWIRHMMWPPSPVASRGGGGGGGPPRVTPSQGVTPRGKNIINLVGKMVKTF